MRVLPRKEIFNSYGRTGRLGNPVPSPSPSKVLSAGRCATPLGRSVLFGNTLRIRLGLLGSFSLFAKYFTRSFPTGHWTKSLSFMELYFSAKSCWRGKVLPSWLLIQLVQDPLLPLRGLDLVPCRQQLDHVCWRADCS
jgi:hypothetical protein